MRLAEVIGQELAVRALLKAIRSGKVNHAYLFAGPEGVGKLTTALAFATALNCDSPTPDGDACGNCLSCRMMADGNHPDIDILRPEGAETKVKPMRELLQNTRYAPVRGKYRVIVIEQADTMNEATANTILKTLEEPPDYLVMILLSRNPVLQLATIRSRCFLVRFSSVPANELAATLVERHGASHEQAEFLASYSEGRPGRAISLLGNEDFDEWRRRLMDLVTLVQTQRRAAALRVSEEFQKLVPAADDEGNTRRANVRQTLDALILIYRDLLSLSVRGDSAELINSDLRDAMAAREVDPQRAASGIETLLWARRALEGNANIQLLSDVLMMRLMC